MGKRPLPFRNNGSLTLDQAARHLKGWQNEGKGRQLTTATLAKRQHVLDKFLWFLGEQRAAECGRTEVREFLAYLSDECSGGRWGDPRLTEPVKSATAKTYFIVLQAFFNFLVEEEILEGSPMERMAAPVHRDDEIQPFTQAQVDALLAAARKSESPARNQALLYFLLDNGIRASEACALRLQDLDLEDRSAWIAEGKGRKGRMVPFGTVTRRALWGYLRDSERAECEPIFISSRGTSSGTGLTRWGLLQLFERLGEASDITGVRCSPHTCRHTFAINFLRGGGTEFALMRILGHTSLAMTRRYVNFVKADIQVQHQHSSPVDRMRRKR